jgi:amino-acid N-acetyltransferase
MERSITIRRATEGDQLSIKELVRSERLNPNQLHWSNFVVAVDQRGLVGAVQLRKHFDGSRELGSLVVKKEARRQQIAARLIEALIRGAGERMLMITASAYAARYGRWGFRPIEASAAPAAVRRNYWIGSLMSLTALFTRGRVSRLVILDRAANAMEDFSRESIDACA